MKTFDVYQHSIYGLQAVKQGFSWPAFGFTVWWALAKKMWGIASLLFLALMVLFIIDLASDINVLIIFIAHLILFIFTGFNANEWRRANLLNRGFTLVKTVSANNPDAAMGSVVSQSQKTATS